MKRLMIIAGLLMVSVYACKPGNRQKLIGKWRAVHVENKKMDSTFMVYQNYIDSFGKGTDSATNMAMYGFTNMDSARNILRVQLDSIRAMQNASVVNTVFQFRNDSVAVLAFGPNVDSSKWYFDSHGKLVLEDLNSFGPGDKIDMDIVSLTDTALKLKFIQGPDTSMVTFHPERREE